MTRQDFIDAAQAAVMKDRQNTYGPPEKSFSLVADLWSHYLNHHAQKPLDPHDIAAMMVLLKIARITINPKHADNWTDLIGYGICGGELATETAIPVSPTEESCKVASSDFDNEEEETPIPHPPSKINFNRDKIAIANTVGRILDRKKRSWTINENALIRRARHYASEMTSEEFLKLMQLTALI